MSLSILRHDYSYVKQTGVAASNSLYIAFYTRHGMMYFKSPLFKTIHHHHQMNVKTYKIELMQIDLPFALHSFTTVLPHFFVGDTMSSSQPSAVWLRILEQLERFDNFFYCPILFWTLCVMACEKCARLTDIPPKLYTTTIQFCCRCTVTCYRQGSFHPCPFVGWWVGWFVTWITQKLPNGFPQSLDGGWVSAAK